MNKFVALLMKEKRPGMNGEMMTSTFFELYSVYIKKLGHLTSENIGPRFFKNTTYTHNPFIKVIKF